MPGLLGGPVRVAGGPAAPLPLPGRPRLSPDSLLARQAHGLEGALWAALRSLEEKTALTRRLAERAVQRGARLSAERFWMHADDDERRAELIREVLLAGHTKALIDGLGY